MDFAKDSQNPDQQADLNEGLNLVADGQGGHQAAACAEG